MNGPVPSAPLPAQVDALVDALLAPEPGARDGADPEELHQMRVAVRRLRVLLKVSGDPLGPAVGGVRRELGWLGSVLGEVRDLDVLIEHLREVVRGFDEVDREPGERLVAEFGARRERARRRMIAALDGDRYPALVRDLRALSGGDVADRGPGGDLVAAVRRSYRKLCRAVAALPDDPPDADLHALRITSKRLRYVAEAARRAADPKRARRLKQLVKACGRLQAVLGEHQDAVVCARRVREVAGDDPAVCFVAGRIVQHEAARRARARARWPETLDDIHAAAAALGLE
ncbi:CHAD domain-containing protein [Amycolatopsis arida]|uniref:CHAD domain-containing protein n=1 Tax=Amycolatopsis arida TaxID=587909 RepID=A0A1I5WIN7_9PSEU|nr:CHAD domain-containing protein [Amycolatopsis arida]TDX92302.1 CHAD domain-containing protein [Amycolatopsis arida]SFQ19529.1 CHAD domain-containing protein [Amycolatopsis arida]